MDSALTVAGWLAPPFLGAIIGYFTNYVAIRMLFRPLEKKHLGFIPVPLTPGVIPKNRGELAANIGDVVARDLLSPNSIQQQLETPEFQMRLQELIHGHRPRFPDLFGRRRQDSEREDGADFIDRQIAGLVITMTVAHLPEMCRVIDVQRTVADRINELDTEEIERNIVQVAGRHLKYINWFGALLGAVIGCLYLVWRVF